MERGMSFIGLGIWGGGWSRLGKEKRVRPVRLRSSVVCAGMWSWDGFAKELFAVTLSLGMVSFNGRDMERRGLGSHPVVEVGAPPAGRTSAGWFGRRGKEEPLLPKSGSHGAQEKGGRQLLALPMEQAKSGTAKNSASFVSRAVRAVGPAVVRIDTERTIHAPSLDPLFEDPTFKRFFGDEIPNMQPKDRLERGQGSGVIVSKDGLLLTNAHVVADAEKVTVTLTDGRSYIGVVKGTDEVVDLAVVKIETKGVDLPIAPLGVSADLEVGDWVLAVGNPLGLDNTVTLGIVSSLNRSAAEVGIPEKRLNFIQTDAAINPGNSGGPLVNEFGQVVGLNTAIRANAEGIGFAIPIDRAKDVLNELSNGRKIQHAYVGIQMVSLTPEFARQNNEDPNAASIIPEVEGAIVIRVIPKSPAATSGVRRFDIIQAIDGTEVRSAKEVQTIVDRAKVGQIVHLRIVRGESEKPIEVQVKTGDLSTIKDLDTKDGHKSQK
uniref:PDZ domain-containing protein n=2 Tax=Compsopogon caeruleus TaxID=31354 RepID=A0A7S1TJS6_9RHOD|mmetsp:Transcript_9982/g.20241  ORF Transcript_9982/g.20241 Transcript_9982/m.20241 type:complete len:491 (+) Transcript_9982:80-1552(+)|eukprot:CAMPEP_0184680686 /NCGR_PEP_ID=MMETSP0312-20130426/3578_1 /TAXON_ID=31354 /ORGANISM="Compsopogon coeruleus, Strain SAG 36.94" /LENGTH=490 /DNA_ID=CAMNT_0027130965 /DNA_START=65 /DNA_END=1537 /DNA_ORIENTATION=+